MAPPQYAAPPPRREPSFLEGWYVFPAGQLSDPLSIIPLPQVYCAGSVVSVLCG
ncbi:cysteine-rich TM module stress tolerance protein [Zea mays]|nr:unknown [Zea mays]ONM10403.1 cysteine-rich TM module stress tolerance protein [Zea mays]